MTNKLRDEKPTPGEKCKPKDECKHEWRQWQMRRCFKCGEQGNWGDWLDSPSPEARSQVDGHEKQECQDEL